MNENKTSAKNLTTSDWIVWEGDTYAVRRVFDYGNGWVAIDLSDGRMVDCLGHRQFITV